MTEDLDTLVSGSRNFLRDFPLFFEVDVGPLNVSTVRLPHPLVPMATLQVVASDVPDTGSSPVMVQVPVEDLQLDERNGLLKFLKPDYFGKRILVAGYHTNWFLDADLAFHASRTLLDVGYGEDFDSLDDFAPIEIDAITMGTVVSALWSLATELALDIDVSTPEGMYIPARQRFQQVVQMWQSWGTQFQERMSNLNMGTGKLEIFWLRRVAYLTNRLVPIYKEREVDQRRPPQRLYPEIPYGVAATDTTPNRPDTVEEIGRVGQEIGWEHIGTIG